jgi:hypothetical protein
MRIDVRYSTFHSDAEHYSVLLHCFFFVFLFESRLTKTRNTNRTEKCIIKINIDEILNEKLICNSRLSRKKYLLNVYLLDYFELIDRKMDLLNYQYLGRDHLKGLNAYKVNNLFFLLFHFIYILTLV